MTSQTCRLCARPFTVTDEEWQFLQEKAKASGWRRVWPPSRCLDCRKQLRAEQETVTGPAIAQVFTCVDCRQSFEFTEREHEFYAARQWRRPSRCKRCRDARKLANGYRVGISMY